jgi:phosphotriesterase-related protein
MEPYASGKIMTVLGPVGLEAFDRVLMHEHLHCDFFDAASGLPVWEEKPSAGRRDYLMAHAMPLLRECREKHGMTAYLDVTMPPWRGWPELYTEVSRASGVHIVMSTGFYREMELGYDWVDRPERQIWPFVRESPEEVLADMCIGELRSGIHGTGVRAGAIKLGTSQAPLTAAELKCFRAGARAQIATGALLTTHCTALGGESSQLAVLDAMGVDLNRVCIGHVAQHMTDPAHLKTLLAWMRRGASFLPTNLNASQPQFYRPLAEAIHRVFDAGLGDRLVVSLDHGYGGTGKGFAPVDYLPPPPFLYFFREVLPALREWGLSEAELDAMLRLNPRRLLALP